MIVFCHLLNDYSGSPRVLRATLRALDAPRDGLLYVGSQGRGVLDEAGVPTRRYWYRRSRHRLVTLFTYFVSQLALYRALAKARDIPGDAVVFVNTLLPFAAMLWGRRTGRRVIVHIHEVSISPAPLRRFLTGCAARCADQLIYVSNDHRARLPIPGVPSAVLANPLDDVLHARALVTPRKPRHAGRFEVLMLASPRDFKGVPEFLRLAGELSTRSDIGFTLVLNGEAGEIASYLSERPVPGNVTVHPRTGDPAGYYAVSDMVLNLSRVDQWIETFGLTLIEAMAFSLPIIAPPIGGPAEIIRDGQEGFLIDSRDHGALAEAVLRLADDVELYARMSDAALARSYDYTDERYAAGLRAKVAALAGSGASV